jgi:tetraacyldisaccharide 4'-kinase
MSEGPEARVITKAMKLYPYQQLFFSTHEFGSLRQVFGKDQKSLETIADKNVLLLTGIASPEQMQTELQTYTKAVTPLAFSDHHAFRKKDVEKINEAFSALPSPKLIVTTEKDETRLLQVEGLSNEVKMHLYALPIKIHILLDQENTFNQNIISYVRKNSRNSILAEKPNDYKPKDSNRSGDRPRTISFRNN